MGSMNRAPTTRLAKSKGTRSRREALWFLWQTAGEDGEDVGYYAEGVVSAPFLLAHRARGVLPGRIRLRRRSALGGKILLWRETGLCRDNLHGCPSFGSPQGAPLHSICMSCPVRLRRMILGFEPPEADPRLGTPQGRPLHSISISRLGRDVAGRGANVHGPANWLQWRGE